MSRIIKYLHLSDNIYPYVTGGTEIFIQKLIDSQIKFKNKYKVMWVCHKSTNSFILNSHNLEKYKFLLDPVVQESRVSRFAFKVREIPGFHDFLKKFEPDIVHIHSFGSSITLNHVEAIKEFGSKIIFTMHTPPCSCMGNLLDASKYDLTGELFDSRCTFIRLRSKGIPYIISKLVAYQNGWPLSPNKKNILFRLLTSRQLTSEMHKSWMILMSKIDMIHVLSNWGKQMLISQNISKSKIFLIKTAGPKKLPFKNKSPLEDKFLKLVFWGRCNPQKGIHILIEAFKMMKNNLDIKLDLYGPYWGDDKYSKKLMDQVKMDSRLRIMGNLPQKELLKKLQEYDLAVVPSIWMETGPLSVLEAFAAGLPVAGTNLAGIKELLINQKGCYLLPPDPLAWKNLFLNLLNNKKCLNKFLPPKIRTFDDIEKEISEMLDFKY